MKAIVITAAWYVLSASAWYLLGKARWYRRGYGEGLDKGTRTTVAIFGEHIIPLLIAKGITPAEFWLALEFKGCGRPDCKACSALAQHKQPN